MAADVNIWTQVQPHQWKWRRRTKRIRCVFIHSTRGGQWHPTEIEFQACINWEISPNNRIPVRDSAGNIIDVYGAMASRIIGGGGRHCVVMPDDVYPYASAGHVDPEAISIEVCQSNPTQAYDDRDIDRTVQETARICIQHGIPPRDLQWISGDNHELPGIGRHDRSANGTKYGKSDPGQMFPWDSFIRRVEAAITGGDELEEIKKALAALAQANAESFARLEKQLAFYGRIQALVLDGKQAQAEAELRYVYALAGVPYPV